MTHRILPYTMTGLDPFAGFESALRHLGIGSPSMPSDTPSDGTTPSPDVPPSPTPAPATITPSQSSSSSSSLAQSASQIGSSAQTWQLIGYGVAGLAVLGVGFYIWRSSK